MQQKIVVTVNSTGRQSASFIRVASAIGWKVHAHVHKHEGIVADELFNLPNVKLMIGRLEERRFVEELFRDAHIAFINTTHWGDEVAIGRSLADAAKKAGILHYIYSSMPDHSTYPQGWAPLPLWSHKFTVENYIRQIGLPATFVYCGIYHNNFTSLNFPLFRMEVQLDGSFEWRAPFHPNHPLPWLDSEHDIGPAVLQLFKEGPRKWNAQRVPLAFSVLSPRQVCKAFSAGLARPVRYVRGPIEIVVPVPTGYKEHLDVLSETLGDRGAPYFGPDLEHECPGVAQQLWEGYRGIEEYAREVFPTEEAANGQLWMEDGDTDTDSRGLEIDFQTSC